MYLLQEPLGRFYLGYESPAVRKALTLPAPSISELVSRGNATLARAVIMRGGRDLATLPIISGTVTIQASSEPFRVLDADVAGLTEWLPVDESHELHPLAQTELRVEIGVRNPYGEDVWVRMGVFTVTSTSADRTVGGHSIRVHCPDRTPRLRRTIMRRAVQTPAPTALELVIAEMLAVSAGDWLDFEAFETGVLLPRGKYGAKGQPPWAFMEAVAKRSGFDLTVNARGNVELLRVRGVEESPVAAVWGVGDSSTLTQLSAAVDITEYATGVVVPWEEHVYNTRWWTDGEGQLRSERYLERIEPRTLYMPDELQDLYVSLSLFDASTINTLSDAVKAGSAEAVRMRRNTEQISGEAMADPFLDCGSVIQLNDPVMGIEMLTRVESLTYTLGSPAMRFALSERVFDARGE